MTVNRDTIAAALMGALLAAVAISGKHGWLTTDDVEILGPAILAVFGAFHVPNARAKSALATVNPAPVPEVQAAAVASAAADPPATPGVP